MEQRERSLATCAGARVSTDANASTSRGGGDSTTPRSFLRAVPPGAARNAEAGPSAAAAAAGDSPQALRDEGPLPADGAQPQDGPAAWSWLWSWS